MWLTWKSWNSWFPPLYWSTDKKTFLNLFWTKIYSLYCCQTAVIKKGFCLHPSIHLFVNLKSVCKKNFNYLKFSDFLILSNVLLSLFIYHKKLIWFAHYSTLFPLESKSQPVFFSLSLVFKITTLWILSHTKKGILIYATVTLCCRFWI